MTTGPNPIAAAWSMIRARTARRPNSTGSSTADHGKFGAILSQLAHGGITAISGADIDAYTSTLAVQDPDTLTRDEALAYWLNLYNAGAIGAAAVASQRGLDSVLRVPGAFTKPVIMVAGESLSLDQIEHGKIRRFCDPRIHGALVCGSVSCPTLRPTPFTGNTLNEELDDQMRSFIHNGGGTLHRSEGTLRLSRVLKWYGRDFTSPAKMPTIVPARPRNVAVAVADWFPTDEAEYIHNEEPNVQFAAYDWALGCSIA